MEFSAATRQESFMELYAPVHGRLVRYIQTIVWNREDAKDIVSETLLKAYENFESVRLPESFIFYLFTIARRLAHKMERRNRWWGLYDHTHSEKMADPHNNADSRTEMNEFKRALNRLPQKQREAIILFEISGFSLAEIQKLQGGSISGVKSRLLRARNELGKMLEYQKSSVDKQRSLTNGENAII
jgi:RNA polymerase sigma-70 factor (ECF subfamily)